MTIAKGINGIYRKPLTVRKSPQESSKKRWFKYQRISDKFEIIKSSLKILKSSSTLRNPSLIPV